MELDPLAPPVGPPAFNSETFGVSAPRIANEAELLAEGVEKVALQDGTFGEADGEGAEGQGVRFGTASVDFRQRYFSGFRAPGEEKGKGEGRKEKEEGGA